MTVLWAADAEQRINPSRILVTTVIDVSNNEIMRDALTLFRSIRLFGGTFNKATFLAYITLEDSYTDTTGLLANLASLRIQWDFIKPVDSKLPKTMNKILTFQRFDGINFDYLLWLDADVVLFRDPIPYLYAHKMPGQIQCVPDVYNYLKRFPHLNGSDLVWSTAMSEYQLDGQNEYAPHGLCNTGVILFDKLSLATFMGGLNETMEIIRENNPYNSDRFLDSLVFVSIVNRYNIDVIIRGYELNYMSFFEIEIQESSRPEDLIFAHLITNTDLYCEKVDLESCLCLYHNTNLKEVSLIFNAMEAAQFSHPHVCGVLAGLITMWEFQKLGHNTSMSFDDSLDLSIQSYQAVTVRSRPTDQQLRLDWPPAGGLVFHDFDEVRVPLQFRWGCSTDEIDFSRAHPIHAVVEIFSLDFSLLLASKSILLLSCEAGPILDWIEFTVQKNGTAEADRNSYRSISETPVQLKLSLIRDGMKSADVSTCSINITLIQNSLAYPGLTRFGDNILLGRRPVALDSQLHFARYVSLWRHKEGQYGAVVCCDTASGVGLVENLIKEWEGEVLMIFLRALPNVRPPKCPADNIPAPVMQDWIVYFNELCRLSGTKIRCAIFDVSLGASDGRNDAYNHGMYLMNRYNLKFVYMDVFEGYHSYRRAITRWLDVLPKGAILMGSRYTHGGIEECVFTDSFGARKEPCPSGPKGAVDAAAYDSRRVVLATYAEESNGFDWSGSNNYCRAYRHLLLAGSRTEDCSQVAPLDGTYNSQSCAWDSVWYQYSQITRLKLSFIKGSECFLRPTEHDCASAWFFHVISKPLPL